MATLDAKIHSIIVIDAHEFRLALKQRAPDAWEAIVTNVITTPDARLHDTTLPSSDGSWPTAHAAWLAGTARALAAYEEDAS